jgi:hypothetical protein
VGRAASNGAGSFGDMRPLRDVMRWTPPIRSVRPTDVNAALVSLAVPASLARVVDTDRWSTSVRPWEVPETAYVLALMDAVVPAELRHRAARGLDVGSKSWSYLAAQRGIVSGQWVGAELDAHRRVGGLQTRASIAHWRLRSFPDCRFIAGSVELVTDSYDVVTWFLPFVTAEPHKRWGLAARAFDPTGLAAHVWSLVAPGGVLVVSNQGDGEAARQAEIFDSLDIDAVCLGPVAGELSPFTNARPVWLARRQR